MDDSDNLILERLGLFKVGISMPVMSTSTMTLGSRALAKKQGSHPLNISGDSAAEPNLAHGVLRLMGGPLVREALQHGRSA